MQDWKADTLISTTSENHTEESHTGLLMWWARLSVSGHLGKQHKLSCDPMTLLQFCYFDWDPKRTGFSLVWKNFVFCTGTVARHGAANSVLSVVSSTWQPKHADHQQLWLICCCPQQGVSLYLVSARLKHSTTLYKTIHSSSSLELRKFPYWLTLVIPFNLINFM